MLVRGSQPIVRSPGTAGRCGEIRKGAGQIPLGAAKEARNRRAESGNEAKLTAHGHPRPVPPPRAAAMHFSPEWPDEVASEEPILLASGRSKEEERGMGQESSQSPRPRNGHRVTSREDLPAYKRFAFQLGTRMPREVRKLKEEPSMLGRRQQTGV